MQSIEYNRENHAILNQKNIALFLHKENHKNTKEAYTDWSKMLNPIYDIPAELQAQYEKSHCAKYDLRQKFMKLVMELG